MSRTAYLIVIVLLAVFGVIDLVFPDHHHAKFAHHFMPFFDILYGFFGCIIIVFVSKAIGKFLLWKTTYSFPLLENSLGFGVESGKVKKWFVDEGVTVKKEQPIAEIETPRGAEVTIRSRVPGKITRLFRDPGEAIHVGETLVDIQVKDEDMPEDAHE